MSKYLERPLSYAEFFQSSPSSTLDAKEAAALAEFHSTCSALSTKTNTALRRQIAVLREGEVVNFSKNYIGAAGLQAIAVLLPTNKNLRVVAMPHNGVTNDALVYFCRAMRSHPRVAELDLSSNPGISLAGGLALLSLVQQTRTIVQITMDGTHIPDAVKLKIEKALQFNISCPPKALPHVAKNAAPLIAAAPPPPALAGPAAPAAKTSDDAALLELLRHRVRQAVHEGYQLPPPLPLTGWRVLEVPILAPPSLFESEIDILVRTVFPRLNAVFAPHWIQLQPVVAGREVSTRKMEAAAMSPRTAGAYLRTVHFRPLADVQADVQRARFCVIELIGDRAGDFVQIPASEMQAMVQTRRFAGDEPAAAEGSEVPVDAAPVELDDAADRPDLFAPLRPILYEAHEVARRTSQWMLIALRRDTKAMHVPAALAPLLSSEPCIAHPDRHRSVARYVVVDAAVADGHPRPPLPEKPKVPARLPMSSEVDANSPPPPQALELPRVMVWDYRTYEVKWNAHVAWRRTVIDTAPIPELVLDGYEAHFDGTGPEGNLKISGLEYFCQTVYDRLHTVLSCLVDEGLAEQREPSERTSTEAFLKELGVQQAWNTEYMNAVAAVGSGASKKNILNRLLLYTANPPSRNIVLAHSTDATTLGTLMARCVVRLQGLKHAYTLAIHTARTTCLSDEPTDLREVLVHLISQLTTDEEVLNFIRWEVDVDRLRLFFLQLLSGCHSKLPILSPEARSVGLSDAVEGYLLSNASSEAHAGHAFVLVVDGLDLISVPVVPCKPLQSQFDSIGGSAEGTHGEGRWSGGAYELSAASDTPEHSAMPEVVPRCLSRDVRLIASCDSRSPELPYYSHRGRDSVEALPVGQTSINDVEQYLSPAVLERLHITLSYDDFQMAREKTDAAVSEYMRYLLSAVCNVTEAPGYRPQSKVIADFPQTLAHAAQEVYDCLVFTFGLPMVRQVLGLLTAARWGLLLPELRVLVGLSPCRLNEFLRLLRPALEVEPPEEAAEMLGSTSGNALLSRIRITSPAFLDVMQREELQCVVEDQHVDVDHRVWHTQLAQFYLSIAHASIQGVENEELLPLRSLHPSGAVPLATQGNRSPSHFDLERIAVKEIIYHMVMSGDFWPQLDATVLCIPFLTLVYRSNLGYHFLRDLTFAFNTRYEKYLLDEDIGEPTEELVTAESGEGTATTLAPMDRSTTSVSRVDGRRLLPSVLIRMRDYVWFAHQHGLQLSAKPALVAQLALEVPRRLLNAVQRDTYTFLVKQMQAACRSHIPYSPNSGRSPAAIFARLFFLSSAESNGTTAPASGTANPVDAATATSGKIGKAPAHCGPVTCAVFLPNRKILLTGSRDRSVAWVNPQTGAVLLHARHPAAPIEKIVVSETSAYAAVLSEDRAIFIYGAADGKLVSQYPGGRFLDAPVTSLGFSSRARYYWIATADLSVRLLSSEGSALCCRMDMPTLLEMTDKAMAAVGPTAAEWRRTRHHAHVLAVPEADECIVTVLGCAVRYWGFVLREAETETQRRVSEEKLDAFDIKSTHRAVLVDAYAICCNEPQDGTPAVTGFEFVQWWQPCEPESIATAGTQYLLAKPMGRSEVRLIQVVPTQDRCHVDGFPVVEKVRPAHTIAIFDYSDYSLAAANRAQVARRAGTTVRVSPDRRWLAICPEKQSGGDVILFSIVSAFTAALQKQSTSGPVVVVVATPTISYKASPPSHRPTAMVDFGFRHDNRGFLTLSRSLQYWQLPAEKVELDATVSGQREQTAEQGEYLLSQEPTCIAVLPPPLHQYCGEDQETPPTTEVVVGDAIGRLSFLRVYRPRV